MPKTTAADPRAAAAATLAPRAAPVFHQGFDLPRPWRSHIASPYPYRHPQGGDPDKLIAAFFAEPLQGAGGVIVPPVGILARSGANAVQAL